MTIDRNDSAQLGLDRNVEVAPLQVAIDVVLRYSFTNDLMALPAQVAEHLFDIATVKPGDA